MLASRDTALITLTEVQGNLPGYKSADDPVLAQLIGQVSGFVSDYCERKFATEARTEYYDGTGTERLYLDHWPISFSAGEGVWESSSYTWDSTTQLTQQVTGTTGYWVAYTSERDLGLIRYLGGKWPIGALNVRVKYTSGYALGSIPAPVVRACHAAIAYLYGRQKQGLTSVTSTSGPGGAGNVTKDPELLKLVAPFLDPYRRVQVVG